MNLQRILIGSGITIGAVVISLAGLLALNAGARHTANIVGSDAYRATWLIRISSDLEYRKSQISEFPVFFKISGRPMTTKFVESSLKGEQHVPESEELTALADGVLIADNWQVLVEELKGANLQSKFIPTTSPVFEKNRDAFYSLLGSQFFFELQNGKFRACAEGKFLWFTNFPNKYDGWIPLPNQFNAFLGSKTKEALSNSSVKEYLKTDFDPDHIDTFILWALPEGFINPMVKSGQLTLPTYKVCGNWRSID